MATTEDLITDIRFFLGNIDDEAITDDDLTTIIEKVKITYPDHDCDQLYYSTIKVLQWLIRKESAENSLDGGGGSLTSKTEKEGNTTYIEEYSEDSTGVGSWSTVLDGLILDPGSLGCDITLADPVSSPMIIGTKIKRLNPQTELGRRCGGDRNINRHWNARRRPYVN